MGSIFCKGITKIKLTSDGYNTLDTVVEFLGDIKRELKLKRKEAFIYGEDLDDIDLEEVDND